MAEKFTVLVQPKAASDVREAYEWLSLHAPEHAEHWLQGLRSSLAGLQYHPEKFPKAPENRFGVFDQVVRQMFYGKGFWKYRVLFFIVEEAVHVIHVRHGARRWVGEESPADED